MSEPQTPSPADRPAGVPVRRIELTELLRGAREVVIVHAQEEYRLRVTRNDKLILTK